MQAILQHVSFLKYFVDSVCILKSPFSLGQRRGSINLEHILQPPEFRETIPTSKLWNTFQALLERALEGSELDRFGWPPCPLVFLPVRTAKLKPSRRYSSVEPDSSCPSWALDVAHQVVPNF